MENEQQKAVKQHRIHEGSSVDVRWECAIYFSFWSVIVLSDYTITNDNIELLQQFQLRWHWDHNDCHNNEIIIIDFRRP